MEKSMVGGAKFACLEVHAKNPNRERAFVSGEFKDYNPRVEHHVSNLIGKLKTTVGQKKEVNFTKLMDNLVFDMYELRQETRCSN
jgi:hypothetical protein